jgi:hypothetical protein
MANNVTGWRAIVAALGVAAVGFLNLLEVGAFYFRFRALDLARTSGEHADTLDQSLMAVGCVALVELAIYIPTGIVFILWFHRIYVLLGSIPGVVRDHHTAWAAWGFIVPIINLFRPPQLALEVATKTSPGNSSPRAALIVFWWVTFILGSFAGAMYTVLAAQDHLGAEQFGTLFAMGGGVALVVSAALAVRVVFYLERLLSGALPPGPGSASHSPPNLRVAADRCPPRSASPVRYNAAGGQRRLNAGPLGG